MDKKKISKLDIDLKIKNNEYLTIRECQIFLNVSRSTICRKIDMHVICPTLKLGNGIVRIPAHSLTEYIKNITK